MSSPKLEIKPNYEIDEEIEEEGEIYILEDFEQGRTDAISDIEAPDEEWISKGEYGEGYFLYHPLVDSGEYPSVWEKKEGSVSSEVTVAVSEVEETEEEKELRRERELLIENLRKKIMDRMMLRRRNAFLQKKLAEHFKKRRMEHVLKEEQKGLDLENKYLKRLYIFKDFKQLQEDEIAELQNTMIQYELETKQLKEKLDEKLTSMMTRAKEVSSNLISSKTGKKINEKTVDRLLKRQLYKNEEKGKKKLRYIKVKNLIEESERNLKSMEYFGEGLHVVDYEQMKIDNQNYTDKIEEKDDELTRMRLKTQDIVQNLTHVREKCYAIEGDIELMEERVYEVEHEFAEIRERLTKARKKRDSLREEFSRLKLVSGLLTKNRLLRDFEATIHEARGLTKSLDKMKKLISMKRKQEVELAKMVMSSSVDVAEIRLASRSRVDFKI